MILSAFGEIAIIVMAATTMPSPGEAATEKEGEEYRAREKNGMG